MPLSRNERVARRRAKLRAAGLRPIQIWVPDTTRPGFAEECRRESLVIAHADASEDCRKEAEFWERVTADSWDDVG
jgi:hypothetical protein